MNKDFLRKQMKEKRRALSEEQIKTASAKICRTLFDMPEYKNAKKVCVYVSAFKEVDTGEIINDCRKKGKKLLFPVTDTKNHTLHLCRDCGSFKKGEYGIYEPSKKNYVSFDEPEIIIVPGIAFDRENNRLGFGEGYYDGLLKESNAVKTGICYDFQLVEKINCEPHDVKMDFVIAKGFGSEE